MKKIFTFLFALLSVNLFAQLYNNDTIYITNDAVFSVTGDFTNETHGLVSLDGKLYLTGNWVNKGASTKSSNKGIGGEIIFSDTNAFQTIGGTRRSVFPKVIILNPKGVVLDQGIYVNDSLLLIEGDFNLRDSMVDLGSTGYLAERSGNRVKATNGAGDEGTGIGTIRATRTLISGNNQNIAGLGIGVNTTTYTGQHLIIRGHEKQQGTGSSTANYSIARYYDVVGIGWLGANNKITFSYDTAELKTNSDTLIDYQDSLMLFQRYIEPATPNSPLWAPLYSTVNGPLKQVTSNDVPYVQHMYDFAHVLLLGDRITLASTFTKIPITLIEFMAYCADGVVKIDWISASEINCDYYTIERSKDAKNWDVVAIVAGAGNSHNNISYVYNDMRPYSGSSYYRLKQTDYDGNYEYFDDYIAVATCTEEFLDITNIYATHNTIFVDFTANVGEKYIVTLYDAIGNLVLSKQGLAQENMNHLELEVPASRGIYFVNFNTDHKTATKKIMMNSLK